MRCSPRTVLSSSLVAFPLALTGCGAGAATDATGTATSGASTSDAATGATTGTTTDAAGTGTTAAETTLFAEDVAHEVSFEWDEAAYADMIAAYGADASKVDPGGHHHRRHARLRHRRPAQGQLDVAQPQRRQQQCQ